MLQTYVLQIIDVFVWRFWHILRITQHALTSMMCLSSLIVANNTCLHGADMDTLQRQEQVTAELAEARGELAAYEDTWGTSGDDLSEMRGQLAVMGQHYQAEVFAKDSELKRLAIDLATYQQQLAGKPCCTACCLLHKWILFITSA